MVVQVPQLRKRVIVFGHFNHIATNIARTEITPATIPTIVPVSRWLLEGELVPPLLLVLLVPDPVPKLDEVLVAVGVDSDDVISPKTSTWVVVLAAAPPGAPRASTT